MLLFKFIIASCRGDNLSTYFYLLHNHTKMPLP